LRALEIISRLSLSRIKILKIIMIKTFLIKIKYLLMVAVKWNCRFIIKGLKHPFLLHHHLVMIIYRIMMLLIKEIIISHLKKVKKIQIKLKIFTKLIFKNRSLTFSKNNAASRLNLSNKWIQEISIVKRIWWMSK